MFLLLKTLFIYLHQPNFFSYSLKLNSFKVSFFETEVYLSVLYKHLIIYLKQFRANCFKWHMCGIIQFSHFHARLFTLWKLVQYLLWSPSYSQFLIYSGHSVLKSWINVINDTSESIIFSTTSVPVHLLLGIMNVSPKSFRYLKQNLGIILYTTISLTCNFFC